MATTFVKNGSNVLVTIGDNDPFSIPGSAFVGPHPSEADVIVISERFDPQNRDAGLKIFVSDVDTPAATDRKDLIEQLSTDFFFRVAPAGFGTVTITGDGVNTDYSMPSDCDITGNFVVNNDIYDAELLLVSGVKTIRFSEILTVEQFPTVAYTKLIGIPSPLPTTGNIDLTDNHTLELADVEKTLWMNSADAKAVTVPLNADVAIPVNTRIELVREGAGTFKIVGDTGVTIKYDPDGTGLVAADAAGVYVNSVGSLIKRSADVWVLIGVLTAV
jgi:hypothetical protein